MVLLYAAVVGLLYGLPHFWLWRDAGPAWSFPHFNVPDERGTYGGRLRALYNGETLNGAPQTLACPDAPTVFPKTGEYLTYGLARIFGLQIRGCLILADFLLPALSVLGSYLFLRALGCSARLSRLAPLTLFLLDPLLASHGPVVALVQGLSWLLGRSLVPYWNCTFLFSRLISPEAALPLVFFASYGTAKAIGSRAWAWPVLAGLLSGLAASAHLAVGLPFLIGLFLFAIGASVTGTIALNRFVPILLSAFVVLAPRILDLYEFFSTPGNPFVLDRHAVTTHAWMGLPYLVLMTVFMVPFLFLYWRRTNRVFWLFLSIQAGSAVCMNLQVVTGSDYGIIHYYGYSFVPMTWLAWFAGLSHRLHGSPGSRWSRILLRRAWTLELACLLYAVANGYAIQHAHYHADSVRWEKPVSRWIEYQSLGPVLSWLEDKASPGDVVVSSPETVDLYAIYSPAKILAQFTIQTCPVPTESYLDRFLVPLKIYGMSWQEAEPAAREMIYDIHMVAETGGSRTWARPDRPPRLQKEEILSLMKAHYEALPEGDALDRMLDGLHVKYVVFGSFERELPGASDAHLKSRNYRLCFEAKGHQIFERLPGSAPSPVP